MSPVIEAIGLKKNYGTTMAVDGIGFAVREGEIFGFLGPNGAGKTTTMKMITCISPRSAGTLTVLGMDPEQDPTAIKARIGVVPQETNLDPDFTCRDNLITYARYFDIEKDEAARRADELLTFVQLQDKRDQPVDKLSGGMKRRLILARALVNNPKILILDEPSIGLDPHARHLIWERLRALKAQGTTIVMTTHYMDEAARLCDRLVIMDYGKILVEGEPAALVKEYIGEEVVEVEKTDAVIACLREMDIPFETLNDTIEITHDGVQDIGRTLYDRCRPRKISTRPATLEDVFLKLAGRELREGA